jgi:hypothetical protein
MNQHTFFLILTSLPLLIGCSDRSGDQASVPNSREAAPQDSPNAALLVEANQSKAWFHAMKVKPLWALKVSEARTIKTIEGNEEVSAGDFICKGEDGDVWPQSAESLLKKYLASEEVNEDGWRKYTPKPDADGVMAVRIDHRFEVTTSWGNLTGKPGDFLLKNFADKDTDFPEDVWIVDQNIFDSTYRASTKPHF